MAEGPPNRVRVPVACFCWRSCELKTLTRTSSHSGHNRSSSKRDAQGSDHLLMNFNVEGPLNKGVVNLHLVRRAGQGEYQYRYLYLDVPGHQRIYLENADAAVSQKAGQTPKTKLFGINWA